MELNHRGDCTLEYEGDLVSQAREEELARRLREMEVAAAHAPDTRDLAALRPDLEQVRSCRLRLPNVITSRRDRLVFEYIRNGLFPGA